MTDEERKAKFRYAIHHTKNLPTLPGIVTKLAKMADDPETTTEQMGKLINMDHILAAKILRLVNSAFYGFPQRISSLSSAIILLGFNVIKSLIISTSIFEIMESQDVELWEHSLGCAVASNVIARKLGIKEPEEISTAGLIHDLGKVAIKIELPEEYQAITALVRTKQIPFREAEMEILGFDHAEAGGWLAKNWNLPNKLVEPVRLHHIPSESKKEAIATAIIHFSDIVIRGLGLGQGQDIWVPPLSKKAWSSLGLTPENLDEILAETEEKLWDVKGFRLEIQATA